MDTMHTGVLKRDIILIAGQLSVGKTTAYNTLYELTRKKGIAVAPAPLADMHFYLKQVERDDEKGGYGHYHNWCTPSHTQDHSGHKHTDKPNMLPFTVSSQEIIDGALFDFCSALTNLPKNNLLYFAQVGGGANAYPGLPIQQLDVSFARLHSLLYNGALPVAWLHRVLAVVHPYASPHDRFLSNLKREAFHHAHTASGTVSSKKDQVVMNMFGRDDFEALEPLFHEYGTPHVYSIHNDFSQRYIEDLTAIGNDILTAPRQRTRNMTKPRDLIMVMGQYSAGKPHIMAQLKELARSKGAALEEETTSDLPLLIDEVYKDDAIGGYNHYHPWCTEKTGGHNHSLREPSSPFTVINNDIVDSMHKTYFETLSRLPSTGKLRFAEISGGENTNPFSEPAYQADFSFKRLVQAFNDSQLPTDWLDRVLAVIHPIVLSDQIRSYINDFEYIHSLDTKNREIVREKRDGIVLNMFGRDDFVYMNDLLKKHYVPHIYAIRHDGTELFALRARRILEELF